MKKMLLPFLMITVLFFASCNNSGDKHDHSVKGAGNQADSLMSEVMDGHNVGMAKMGKIRSFQAQVQRMIDSIATLPAKARQSSAPLKARLDSLAADLSYAEMAMDKWMSEFDMDSAKNDMQKRIDYLMNEKMKVGKVKEAILNGIEKTDSLLKAKF